MVKRALLARVATIGLLLACCSTARPPLARAQGAAGDGDEARVTVSLREVSLPTALGLIAACGDGAFVIGDSVRGRVTLDLDRVPWRTALQRALDAAGEGRYALEETDGVLRVVALQPAAAAGAGNPDAPPAGGSPGGLQTRVIGLRWTPPAHGGEPVAARAARDALAASGGVDGESVVWDERSRGLIVRSTPGRLDRLADLVARWDVAPGQARVRIRVIGFSGRQLPPELREAAQAPPGRFPFAPGEGASFQGPATISESQMAAILARAARDRQIRPLPETVLNAVDDERVTLELDARAGGEPARFTIEVTARVATDTVVALRIATAGGTGAPGEQKNEAGADAARVDLGNGRSIRLPAIDETASTTAVVDDMTAVVGGLELVRVIEVGGKKETIREKLLIFVTPSILQKGTR